MFTKREIPLSDRKLQRREHLKKLARFRMKLTNVHLLISAAVIVIIFGAIMKSLEHN